MQAGNIGGMSSMAQCSQICHCEAPTGPWRPEREARGSALGVQSQQHSAGSQGTPGEYGNFTRRGVEDTAPYKACASGVHATKPTACKALTERRYRRNRFVRFYRQPVHFGSTAPGPAVRSPTTHNWRPCASPALTRVVQYHKTPHNGGCNGSVHCAVSSAGPV